MPQLFIHLKLLNILIQLVMNNQRHGRIKQLCENCGAHTKRYVKKAPRVCMNKNDYLACHRLCKPCWKKLDYGERHKMWKGSCCVCNSQKCWICGQMGGIWRDDIRKVLCCGCL